MQQELFQTQTDLPGIWTGKHNPVSCNGMFSDAIKIWYQQITNDSSWYFEKQLSLEAFHSKGNIISRYRHYLNQILNKESSCI